MPLSDETKECFARLVHAVQTNNLCVMQCKHVDSNESIPVIGMFTIVDNKCDFVPLATPFMGDPYKTIQVPVMGAEVFIGA